MHKYSFFGLIIKKIKKIIRFLNLESFFRLILISFTDFFSKNIISSNSKYKNIYLGKTCFILGTGGSLNDIDFSFLKKEVVFGSNFLINHTDLKKLELDYYFEIDPIYELFLSDKDSISFSPIIKTDNDLNPYKRKNKNRFLYRVNPYIYFKEIERKLSSKTTIFFNSTNKKFIDKNLLFRKFNTSFLSGLKPMSQSKNQFIDISKRITFFDGCIYGMIASAFYMGFNKIYLAGADYALYPSFIYHFYDQPTFLKTKDLKSSKRRIYQFAKINNLEVKEIKEDELYFKPIFINKYMDYSKHQIVKKIADELNVKIYLITPDGFESPVYDKISWSEILELKNKINVK